MLTENKQRPSVEQADRSDSDEHRIPLESFDQRLGQSTDNEQTDHKGLDGVCKRCHSFGASHFDYANQKKESILAVLIGQTPGFFVGVLIACFSVIQWLPGFWDSMWDCTGSTESVLTCTRKAILK